MQRAVEKLKVVVPLTLLIIFLLLFLNFGRMTETLIVMLSLPFSLVGGLWFLWWLGFNMSVAVAVGFIALARRGGRDRRRHADLPRPGAGRSEGVARCSWRPFTKADLNEAIMLGAVERVRPKMMTVVAIMAGLLPILWKHRHGVGSHAAHRCADDWRHGIVDGADPRCDPSCLCAD